MLIICAGLKRAGSTLQYQLCKELLEINYSLMDYGYTNKEKDITKSFLNRNKYKCSIIKTHNYFDILKDYSERNNVLILSSYRDLRDSSVSQMLAYKKTYSQLINGGWLQNEINTFYSLNNLDNVLMQDFLMLKNDLRSSVLDIAKYLKLKLNENSLNKIISKYTIEAQQQKINNYKKTNKYKIKNFINQMISIIFPFSLLQAISILNIDKSTLLHYNHINKEKVDWSSFYSMEQKVEIKYIIGDWLMDVGYEKDKNW